MNQTHIHLLITHLPVFGSVLGAFVLAYALFTRSNQTKMAAYYLFIIAALGAGIAYLTGEAAEETAENIQGVAENMIEQHEDFALYALISLITLGVSALGGIFLTWKNSPWVRRAALAVLFIAIISFVLVGRTAYLGGQIRHTEINNPPVSVQGQDAEGEHED